MIDDDVLDLTICIYMLAEKGIEVQLVMCWVHYHYGDGTLDLNYVY